MMIGWWRWGRPRKRKPTRPVPFPGEWNAVRAGRLIGHSSTAAELVDQLIAMGQAGRGCVCWYEAPAGEVWLWAVEMDEHPARTVPSCFFPSYEQAQRWLASLGEPGRVVTRSGQRNGRKPPE